MTRRTDRLGSVIQEEITMLLTRGRLKDPRIHEMTTVTGVRVSGDLSIATVFFTVMGEADIETTRKGLEAAGGFIQRHLAKVMTIRVVPFVRFEYDPSVAHGDRINRILAGLPELREPPAQDDGAGEAEEDAAEPTAPAPEDRD